LFCNIFIIILLSF